MSQIDFTKSPADLFKDAARAHAWINGEYQRAMASIQPLASALENAKANLDWVAAHPGNAGADLGLLYAAAVESLETDPLVPVDKPSEPAKAAEEPATAEEPAKPKRTRRTKAQIEADNAAAEAAKAQAADETPVEPEVVEGPKHEISNPEPGLTVATFPSAPETAQEPVAAPAVPAAPAAAFTPPPAVPAAPVGSDPFNPFGVSQG